MGRWNPKAGCRSAGFLGKPHTVAGQPDDPWAVGEVGAQMEWKLEPRWSNTQSAEMKEIPRVGGFQKREKDPQASMASLTLLLDNQMTRGQ